MVEHFSEHLFIRFYKFQRNFQSTWLLGAVRFCKIQGPSRL